MPPSTEDDTTKLILERNKIYLRPVRKEHECLFKVYKIIVEEGRHGNKFYFERSSSRFRLSKKKIYILPEMGQKPFEAVYYRRKKEVWIQEVTAVAAPVYQRTRPGPLR